MPPNIFKRGGYDAFNNMLTLNTEWSLKTIGELFSVKLSPKTIKWHKSTWNFPRQTFYTLCDIKRGRDYMKIRFIPIAQVSVVAMAMLGIQQLSPNINIQGTLNLPLSIALLTLGLTLVAIGGREFFRKNTTVNPSNPEKTTCLVTGGIYKYSRNPMYAGFVLCLLAWAALIGSYASLACLPVFVWYITTYQIIPEETALEKKFGDSFIDYKGKVRRWL